MPSDDNEIQNALLAIHSRLGTIEGKINLVARAERDGALRVLEEVVKKDPLVGQVYLVLDGHRSQQEVIEQLARFGIEPSQSTVSRRMKDLVSEYGVADPVGVGVLRKNRAAEDILNLTSRMMRWLQSADQTIPVEARTRSAKKAKE